MDPEAHTLYLKSLYQLRKRTPEGLRQAQLLLDQAVERDPEQAALHAGLADAWALIGAYSVLPPADSFPRAIAAARRALELDENLAEARAALALCTFLYEWKWDEAEAEFRRATSGITDELRALYDRGYAADAKAFDAIGYREAARAIRGELATDELAGEIAKATRAYAKRQLVWLRGQHDTVAVDSADHEHAVELAARFFEGVANR